MLSSDHSPLSRHEGNEVARGGQILTDIEIIKREENTSRKLLLGSGFNELYGRPFALAEEVIQCREIVEMATFAPIFSHCIALRRMTETRKYCHEQTC